MAMITEAVVRKYFTNNNEMVFRLSDDDRLTPSALDFLKDRHIAIEQTASVSMPLPTVHAKPLKGTDWLTDTTFINFYTGAELSAKPESMTHLYNNVLVYKDDQRIKLRGDLDHLQAAIIKSQVEFFERKRLDLADALEDLLKHARLILGAEVLNKPLEEARMMGLTAEEIRERSHNVERYFKIKQMVLPHYRQGFFVIELNLLRTLSRQCEVVAVTTFRKGDDIEQPSIIKGLNRLSSCFHLLMYQELKLQQEGAR